MVRSQGLKAAGLCRVELPSEAGNTECWQSGKNCICLQNLDNFLEEAGALLLIHCLGPVCICDGHNLALALDGIKRLRKLPA